MGLLWDSYQLHQEKKRNFVLEKLKEKGIYRTKEGISIDDLDYESLKYELVLAAFREIDVESDQNGWF